MKEVPHVTTALQGIRPGGECEDSLFHRVPASTLLFTGYRPPVLQYILDILDILGPLAGEFRYTGRNGLQGL